MSRTNPKTALSAVLLSLFTASGLATANSYQYEIRGNFNHYHLDEEITVEDDVYTLEGTYYFTPINTQQYPLAEAAFMARAKSLSLDYSDSRSDVQGRSDLNPSKVFTQDATDQQLTATARAYWFDGWLYTAVSIAESRVKYTVLTHTNGVLTEKISGEHHDHAYVDGSIGVSPAAGLLIYTNIYDGRSYSDSPNINVQYLHDFGGTALAAHLRYIDLYDNEVTNLQLDYYLTPRLSVGAGYEHADHYNLSYDWAINSRYFVTHNISIECSYEHYADGDAVAIGAGIRF